MPGRTAFADVPDLVAQNQPQFTVLVQQLSAAPSYALQSDNFSGSIGSIRQRVGAVRLQIPIPLWRMILLLGTPRCARLYGRRGGPRLLEVGWNLPPVVVWYDAQPGPQNAELAADTITLRLAGEVCTRMDERYYPNFARIQRFLR